ncbi:hypothetical protein HMPREF1986_01208 [Oribacterium sp. oral taxon 078 str. F0263]|nr:hypothetical protein HMPREF1986_01208 [Oribacterium sp. oral taxon 078 str. F0263]
MVGPILSYMAKERFCSYWGRHVELCKHSNSADTEKEGPMHETILVSAYRS